MLADCIFLAIVLENIGTLEIQLSNSRGACIRGELGNIQIQISLSGLPDQVDCTWDPLKQVIEYMLN